MWRRLAATAVTLTWGGIILAGCGERPTAPLAATPPLADIGVQLGSVVGVYATPESVDTYTGPPGVVLSGEVEGSPDGVAWQWTVEGGPDAGSFPDGDGSQQVSFVATSEGDYWVQLRACIYDEEIGDLCGYAYVTVYAEENKAPTAIASALPTSVMAGDQVCFDGEGSSDPNDQALEYLWAFGDGSTPSTEQGPCHVYTAGGVFTATLTVTDPLGLSDDSTVTITVTQPSPQAALQSLIADVQALVTAQALSEDRGAGLVEKLSFAITSLDNGVERDACKQLAAFVKQVKGTVKARKLSQAAGQELIDAAESIRTQIGCG